MKSHATICTCFFVATEETRARVGEKGSVYDVEAGSVGFLMGGICVSERFRGLSELRLMLEEHGMAMTTGSRKTAKVDGDGCESPVSVMCATAWTLLCLKLYNVVHN